MFEDVLKWWQRASSVCKRHSTALRRPPQYYYSCALLLATRVPRCKQPRTSLHTQRYKEKTQNCSAAQRNYFFAHIRVRTHIVIARTVRVSAVENRSFCTQFKNTHVRYKTKVQSKREERSAYMGRPTQNECTTSRATCTGNGLMLWVQFYVRLHFGDPHLIGTFESGFMVIFCL